MKKFVLFFAVIFTTLISFTSCKEKDVVKDFPAVHKWDPHSLETIDKIKSLPNKERFDFIKKNLPHLIPIITDRVKKIEPDISIDSIAFVFGSGKAKGVEDATGARNNGIFKDQLLAKVFTKQKTKFGNPVIVFVRCLNGVLEIKGEMKDVGGISSSFTILPGEGLADHLPQLNVWGNTANEIGVPIKNSENKIVSKKIYANYLGYYESVLFPYDVINMDTKTAYNKMGQEIDFESRLAETKKANLLILKNRINEIEKMRPKSKTGKLAKTKKLKELKNELKKLQSERKKLK